MVFSAKGLFWTGSTGLLGSFFFFPFPEEKEKENPPAAEGVRPAEGIGLGAELLCGGSGSRGFLRRPRMVLWPVQGYLSSSLRSWTSFARKGLRWI